jgi:hypothetical protein
VIAVPHESFSETSRLFVDIISVQWPLDASHTPGSFEEKIFQLRTRPHRSHAGTHHLRAHQQ